MEKEIEEFKKNFEKSSTIEEYSSQIDYLEDILNALEDLRILYGKDYKTFKNDYKDTGAQMEWIEEMQDELKERKQELIDIKVKEHEKDLAGMNAEFERSRL